jgi:hypothetical protein
MRMPARTEDQGADLAEKLASIKSRLIEECGGSLCVKIAIAYTGNGTRCQYSGSDPAPGSIFRYRKNMTVTIIAGSEQCDGDSPGDGSGDGSGDGTDEGSGDGNGNGTGSGSGDGSDDGTDEGSGNGTDNGSGTSTDDGSGGDTADDGSS